jgi:hypothetical protein
MESRQPDTKRKVGFGRDEAGRDAKRLCQLTETSHVAQPSTDSSTFFDLALQAVQEQGLRDTDTLDWPNCSAPSASAYYGDQVEGLLFDGDLEPQYEPFFPTNCPEWDELDYSGLDPTPSPDRNYSTTRQGDTIIANNEVEAEPIDTEVAACSNSVGATSVGSDYNVGYDTCFGVVSRRDSDIVSTTY